MSQSSSRTARLGEVESLTVEGLVEGCFGLLLGHRAAALQPDTGEEHLLVQPDAASADEHHAGDGRDERLRQVVDDDGGHPVQRRVDAPQRAAQQPLRLLHDRVTEVDVDQVVATLGGVGVERDRAQHTRVEAGVQALAACPANRRSGSAARTPRRRCPGRSPIGIERD